MKQICKVDQFQILSDLKGMPFLRIPVTFTDGTTLDLAVPPAELTSLIHHLIGINQTLTEIGAETATPGEAGKVGPITVHDMGLAQVDKAAENTALVVADLAWSRLLLQVPLESLSSLGTQMSQTAQALAVPATSRPN